MRSALECCQHAAQCEQRARSTIDPAERAALLATAKHWRVRAEMAKAAEAAEAPDAPSSSDRANDN